MNTIREIVEDALAKKGITAKKMCEDLEMPDATLYQIFRKNSGRKTTLDKLGKYLDVNLNISFGQNQDISSMQKLVDYLRKENDFLRSYINDNLMANLGKFNVSGLHGVNFFCSY